MNGGIGHGKVVEMQKLKDENYYVVHAWMINRLDLNGNELIVFAIMYGFCQDGAHEFKGSLTYIMEWMGVKSKHTVIKAIEGLVSKGYIDKKTTLDESGTHSVNAYKINYMTIDETKNVAAKEPEKGSAENALPSAENALPSAKNAPGGSAECAPRVVQKMHQGSAKNAPNNNIYKDNNKDIYISDSPKNPPYQKIVDMYNTYCKSLASVKIVSEKRKKSIKSLWTEFKGEESSFLQLFSMAEESDFLTGRDGKWSPGANFDWLMNVNNAIKVLEGNYKNKNKQTAKTNGKNDIIAAQEELARRLGENGYNESSSDDAIWCVWEG